MGVPLHPALRASIWVVVTPLLLYSLFIGLSITPFFQRQYASTRADYFVQLG